MNSGCSAFTSTHGHSVVTMAAASWYQTSRTGSMATFPPVRRTTTTWSTPPTRSMAVSTLALSGTLRPPRRPSSAVMTSLDWQPSMRPASASGEKPPNTTEWMAPSRAQASMA